MGSDLYCFLCSAGFYIPYPIYHEDEYAEFLRDIHNDLDGDPIEERTTLRMLKLFPRDKILPRVQWLEKFRVIGENANVTSVNKCYLSGPAIEEEFGSASIAASDHPNAQNLPSAVSCYQDSDNPAGALPIHDACLEILSAVFSQAQRLPTLWKPGNSTTTPPFNLDTLFSCLAEKRSPNEYSMKLGHDLEVDQYFCLDWNQVVYYFDPTDLSKSENKPSVASQHKTLRAPSSRSINPEILGTLPDELLLSIVDLMDRCDLASMLQVSRTVRRICDSNAFWKRRLNIDAPWSGPIKETRSRRSPDYRQIYLDTMMQISRPAELALRGVYVSGLANRERIWKNAKQVQHLYEQISPLDSQEKARSAFEDGAVCRLFSRVADQQSSKGKLQPDTTFFFLDQSDLHLPKRMELVWSPGSLCAVKTRVGAHFTSCGSISAPNQQLDVVEFKADDWIDSIVLTIGTVPLVESAGSDNERSESTSITGIRIYSLQGMEIVFGEDNGYKRLLEPKPGCGIVGLRTETARNQICRVGIVEHRNGIAKQRVARDPKYLKHLWTKYPLPQGLRLGNAESGYWSTDTHPDLLPMELVLLGTNEEELSTVVGFGQSLDRESFAVYRANGSCEIVGKPGCPMKKFAIDGPGGERIVGFVVTIGALPVGLKVVTNHGRQAIFGTSADNAHQRFTAERGCGLAGLYCCFGYAQNERALLNVLGPVRSPHLQALSMDPVASPPDGALPWEPKAPPASWKLRGTLHGTEHNGEVARMLDFSRPVTKIEGLYAAPDSLDIIAIGGFTVFYGDDSLLDPTADLGWRAPRWPAGPNVTEADIRKMNSEDLTLFGSQEAFRAGKENAGSSHVASFEEALNQPSVWSLGDGERIVAVSVWSSTFLNGLQFHSESGQDSPKWGKCGGEPITVIRAGGADDVVGLKVILGTLRHQYKSKTVFPQAVQALGRVE